jgi:hypothetical protein
VEVSMKVVRATPIPNLKLIKSVIFSLKHFDNTEKASQCNRTDSSPVNGRFESNGNKFIR